MSLDHIRHFAEMVCNGVNYNKTDVPMLRKKVRHGMKKVLERRKVPRLKNKNVT